MNAQRLAERRVHVSHRCRIVCSCEEDGDSEIGCLSAIPIPGMVLANLKEFGKYLRSKY